MEDSATARLVGLTLTSIYFACLLLSALAM
jgi:hypothetical protein